MKLQFKSIHYSSIIVGLKIENLRYNYHTHLLKFTLNNAHEKNKINKT